MSWIQTFTRRAFYPFNPYVQDIDIQDIAHSLAHICRFNGHVRKFYSVAEHCMRVSGMFPSNPIAARWGLLHDAAEAYVGNVMAPLRGTWPVQKEAENQILCCVAEKFNLPLDRPQAVKTADLRWLMTEARDLMSKKPREWDCKLEPYPDQVILEPLSPEQAERSFIDVFNILFAKEAAKRSSYQSGVVDLAALSLSSQSAAQEPQ